MIKRLLVFCLLAVSYGRAADAPGLTPSYSFLWNTYVQVMAAGDNVIGLSDQGVAVLSFDSTHTFLEQQSYILLDGKSAKMKRYGDLLAVGTSDGHMHFVDLSTLPAMTYLGGASLGVTFADFALNGNDLYLSRWFDGILHYQLDDYSNIRPVDYSMTGVLVTQLDIVAGQLLALDEYNGIMRYDLAGNGVTTLNEYFYLPQRAIAFVPCGASLLIPLQSKNVLVGELYGDGAAVIDSIEMASPQKLLAAGERLVALTGQRSYQLIDRSDWAIIGSGSIGGCRFEGDVLNLDGAEYLLLPGEFTGLSLIPLDNASAARQVLRWPGPVICLEVIDHKLFTGGIKTPLEVFTCDTMAAPRREYTIYEEAGPVKATDHNGDSLFALFTRPGRLVVIAGASDSDSFSLGQSISVDAVPITRIRFAGTIHPPLQCLLAMQDSIVDVYGFSQAVPFTQVGRWEFSGPVEAITLEDTLVFVSIGGRTLLIYSVNSDYTLTPVSQTVLSADAQEIVLAGSRVVLFQWDQLTVYDCSDPTHPEYVTSQALSMPVVRALVEGDRLFAIGSEGVAVFRLTDAAPELLDLGRHGGFMLALDDNLLATSDGASVHIYDVSGIGDNGPEPEVLLPMLTHSRNYPNPFNTSTNIAYNLDASSRVRIVVYNVLGHEVRRLLDQTKAAGDHRVEWDGSNDAGQPVASGIYFYRIATDLYVEVNKMVLIK
jgi:hypothetical protein